jgi:hypothetical protein
MGLSMPVNRLRDMDFFPPIDMEELAEHLQQYHMITSVRSQ